MTASGFAGKTLITPECFPGFTYSFMVGENKALLFNFSKINSKAMIFLITKDWHFCDQILIFQTVAIETL